MGVPTRRRRRIWVGTPLPGPWHYPDSRPEIVDAYRVFCPIRFRRRCLSAALKIAICTIAVWSKLHPWQKLHMVTRFRASGSGVPFLRKQQPNDGAEAVLVIDTWLLAEALDFTERYKPDALVLVACDGHPARSGSASQASHMRGSPPSSERKNPAPMPGSLSVSGTYFSIV